MGGKFQHNKTVNKSHGPPSRKHLRKQMRIEKKAKKNEYFKNKKKFALLKTSTTNSPNNEENAPKKHSSKTLADHSSKENHQNTSQSVSYRPTTKKPGKSFFEVQNKQHKQEMREKAKLERGMKNVRKKMLLEANKEEDKEIKRLEKQLKLNKRKSKTVPKSFVDEGLDWLLEVCDTEKLHNLGKLESNLQESGSEFEDDFAVVTGKEKRKVKQSEDSSQNVKKLKTTSLKRDIGSSENDSHSGSSEEADSSDENEEYMSEGDINEEEAEHDMSSDENENNVYEDENDDQSDSEDVGSEDNEEFEESDIEMEDEKKKSFDHDDSNSVTENSDKTTELKNGVWEDIYGRLRDKKGNIVQVQEKSKYVPPQLRAKQLGQDSKNAEELARLKKQLKGLINRLAESNLHSIANQIDELYMRNVRNDMNDSLLSLISEALVARVLTPERLVIEHTALIAVLHANVGLEVGAHFLQSFVQKFDSLLNIAPDVEDKELDNILQIISHLYNFKVFHAVLMYNILDKLIERFTEKEVELILLVLRSVGFSLRKDDPLALKNLVLRLQKKANESNHFKDNPRVKFMLDILLAVKNNNVAKIPQYDPTYSEHIRKLMKTMIHKGKYITELKITLEDLLKAEERGRWWIVGSAWAGTDTTPGPHTSNPSPATPGSQFSQAVLDLARKQRMNTDTRRNIFCILVSAEDYLDAFEKLLRLGLKGQQEQEIIHVVVHCLMQEKSYNPYYAYLANHFCKADRKHQMTIQYHIWDKLKELSNLSQPKITNLAKFLAYLFLEKALPISILKVMQFSEMDKHHVRLLRQVLLSVLLNDSAETVAAVFSRVSRPEKLHMFRESLRLFLHHFVLRNVKDLPSDQAETLRERVKLAETALTMDDNRAKFL